MNYFKLFFLTVLTIISGSSFAQNCTGGQIFTHEAFLHGRFEVKMQSAAGSGVVSSFFLYNLDLNCNWPAENNEIDIEMTGNKDSLYFTTHYPGTSFPWSFGDIYEPPFNPHDTMMEYAFEWTPGVVRWFVDGQLVYTQNQSFVSQLIHPMRIMMNLWAANAPSWVGPWNPAIMPLQSEYELVRYYSYTPGSGTYGTGNNFTFQWEDNFNSFDATRWEISQDAGFNGNYCRFKGSNVKFQNGRLILEMTDPDPNPATIPVTFSVNANGKNFAPSDGIFVAGDFNGWCGNCNPMTNSNGTYTTTINLEPGDYQWVYTRNNWQTVSNAPLGSECDVVPCDQYQNYGATVDFGSAPVINPTHCWGSCEPCEEYLIPEISTDNIEATKARLNWSPVGACNNSYTIRGKLLGTSNWITLNIANGSPDFLNVTGLSNNSTYIWQIKAKCKSNTTFETVWSALDTFTTGCFPPDSLWQSVTSTTVLLNWTPSAGAYGYEIVGGELFGNGDFVSLILPGTGTNFFAPGLKPNTVYIWQIRAFCSSTGSIASPFSPWQQFTTASNKTDEIVAEINIFPNPSTGEFVIDLGKREEEVHVKISNLAGQEVYSEHVFDIDQLRVDVDLQAGIYFLMLETSNYNKSIKISITQ